MTKMPPQTINAVYSSMGSASKDDPSTIFAGVERTQEGVVFSVSRQKDRTIDMGEQQNTNYAPETIRISHADANRIANVYEITKMTNPDFVAIGFTKGADAPSVIVVSKKKMNDVMAACIAVNSINKESARSHDVDAAQSPRSQATSAQIECPFERMRRVMGDTYSTIRKQGPVPA